MALHSRKIADIRIVRSFRSASWRNRQ